MTISAALEEKLTHPDEVIDCQMGQIVINGMRIRDHEKLGLLTVSQILAKSSDVGSIKLGPRGWATSDSTSTFARSDSGRRPESNCRGRRVGLAKPVSRWSKVSIGAISMGQEVGISAVQLVSMVSTIANDGVYNAPRIVAGETQPSSGYQQVMFHPAQPAESDVAADLGADAQMMEGVVLFGTGRKAILDGYTSAGKTGTAQKIDPTTRAYSKTDYVGSFAGFAPVNNPRYTIVVIIDSAKGLHQGGQIAAPVFKRISQQVLAYMNVPHDAEIKNDPRRKMLLASVKDERPRR